MKRVFIFLLFLTLVVCNGFAQDLLNEGFEGPAMPPSGWILQANSPETSWSGWEKSTSTKHSGNYSAYVPWSNESHDSYLITPQLTLSGHQVLSFWLATDYPTYSYNTTFTVEISTTSSTLESFSVLQTVTLPTADNQQNQFINVVIDLLPYAGQTVYLAFHILDYAGTGIFLDDINVSGMPTCYAPTDVTVSNIGENTATVSWTGDPGAAAYVVDYLNMSHPSPSAYDTVTGLSTVLTGLQSTTNYRVRVKSICNDLTTSSWSDVVWFYTACPPYTVSQDQAWFEDFEGLVGTTNVQLNSCWSTPQRSSTYNSPYCLLDMPSAAHSGSNSLLMRGDEGEVNLVLLPVFTNDLNTLRLGFYANTSSGSAAYAGSLVVGYVTNEADPYSFVPLFPITPNDSSLGRAYSVYYGPFDFLAAPPDASRMAIRYTSNAWSSNWALDDISVSLIPACSAPNQLATTEVTSSTATVYWLGQTTPTYQLLYWQQGSTDTTVVSNITYNANGYVITGLSESTTYEWTVRAVCGDGTSYAANSVISFTTPYNASELPYLQNFDDVDLEDITEYAISGTGSNQWVKGSATGNLGNSMYISGNGGATNTYTADPSFSYAELDIRFPNNDYEYHLNFDYKVVGEPGYDWFSVYLADETSEIVIGSEPPGILLMPPTVNTPNWMNADFTLSGVAGTTKKIIFYWTNDYLICNDPPVAVDNISINYYTCTQPSNLSVNNITDDGARLSWLENGNANSWIVFYKPVYSSTDLYDEIYTSDIPSATLVDLHSNTLYDCYVVSLCDDGQYSSESVHFTFKTQCGDEGISYLPFAEDFDNYTYVNGSYYVPCWTRLYSNPSYFPYVNVNDVLYYGSPCLDFNYTTNCYTMAVLPAFSSSIPLNSVKVEFDARRGSFAGGALEIGAMTDPNNPLSFEVIDTIRLVYTNNWEHQQIYCQDYTGTGTNLAFRVANAGDNPVLIDNLVVDNLPECLPASSLAVSDISYTTATLSWHGNGSDYDVYVISSDTVHYNTRDTYLELTNLRPSSSYNVQIIPNCYGQSAEVVAQVSFFTLCGAIAVTEENPWVETFENYHGNEYSAIEFTPCWLTPLTYAEYNAVFPTVFNYSYAAHSGDNMVEFRGQDLLLELPEFSTLINSLRFSFWASTTAMSSAEAGVLEVGVVHGDPSTFVVVDTVDVTAFMVQGHDSENADLMGPYDFNVIETPHPGMRIAIRYRSNNNYTSCYLDDFVVSLIPYCSSPRKSSVKVNNIMSDQAEVSWVDRDASHLVWTVYYKPSSADEDAWMSTDSYTATTTLYNLLPNTAYDVYVVTKCNSVAGEDATRVTHFVTAQLPERVPYSTQFNDPTEWKIDNGTCDSRWMVGAVNELTNGLFVTEDGVTPGYAVAPTSLVVAEKLFTIGTNSQFQIEFDLRVGGEYYSGTDCDFMKLFFAPATQKYEATSSSTPPAWSNPTYSTYACDFSEYVGQTLGSSSPYKISLTNGNTIHVSAVLYNPNLDPEDSSTAKLVFVWRNDINEGNQPGAIITNLSLTPILCPQPSNLAAVNVGASNVDVVWTGTSVETSWVLSYRATNDVMWTEVTVDTTYYQISGLMPQTNYEVRVVSNCGGGQTSLYSEISFTTSTCNVEDQCDYILSLTDSYGDGWNGAYIELRQNNGVIGTYTVANFSYNFTKTLTLCHGNSISMIWYSGSFDEECSISLTGPDGEVLYSVTSLNAYSGTALFTFTTDCPNASSCSAPVGLTASIVTNNSAQVSWNAGTATEWKLQYKTLAATDWLPEITLSNNHYALTGLMEATTYQVRVKTVCSDILSSSWSQPLSFQTAASSTPVEPTVVTYNATNITPSSAGLNGAITNLGNQTILERGFEWKATSASAYNQVTTSGNTLYYLLDNLTPNTSYTYRAYATTSNMTTYGQDVTFMTSPLQCLTPANLTQLSVAENSLTVVWTNYADATAWQLQYRKDNDDWTIVDANATYFTLTGLAPATTYELQVRAVCAEDNVSEWSQSLIVTTIGINQYLQNQITLVPNPAKEYVNVQCTMNDAQWEGAEIEVLDAYGKLLQTIELSSETTRINVHHLANGVYFVRVNTKAGSVTKKFVKE